MYVCRTPFLTISLSLPYLSLPFSHCKLFLFLPALVNYITNQNITCLNFSQTLFGPKGHSNMCAQIQVYIYFIYHLKPSVSIIISVSYNNKSTNWWVLSIQQAIWLSSAVSEITKAVVRSEVIFESDRTELHLLASRTSPSLLSKVICPVMAPQTPGRVGEDLQRYKQHCFRHSVTNDQLVTMKSIRYYNLPENTCSSNTFCLF